MRLDTLTTPIRFSESVLHDLRASIGLEWLESNGLGAYASSTIIGCNTRKYHGLLVSPAPGSDQRFVFLSRIETSLITGAGIHPISTNQYPGTVYPEGYRYASMFTLGAFPKTCYRIGETELEYSVLMRYERPMVLLRYKLLAVEGRALLELHPLLAFRDFNGTCSENSRVNMKARRSKGTFSFSPYNEMPAVFFSGSAKMEFDAGPDWYRKTEYVREMERGYDFREDLFTPGSFSVELESGKEFTLAVSIGKPEETPEEALALELARRQEEYSNGDDILRRGADHFIITNKRASKASIIAGFPWFGEWGRDAMISLPGLTLCRGEPEIALQILESFASFEQNGLFPNQLHVYGDSSYNTVDASLWFFWAAQKYVEYTGAPSW